MDNQQNTQSQFNWFNFWTIAIAITTMLITAHGIEKNHKDVDEALKETKKSVELSNKQYELSWQQYEDSKKQIQEANTEAQAQRALQKLQFEKQLNELRKQSNASIKQIDYQIKAQRPIIQIKDAGIFRTTKDSIPYFKFYLENFGGRPAKTLFCNYAFYNKEKDSIIYYMKNVEDILLVSKIPISISTLNNIILNSDVFLFIDISYSDLSTKEVYSQKFVFKTVPKIGEGQMTGNTDNQEYKKFDIALNKDKKIVIDRMNSSTFKF